jgi:cell wall-associated NlpC family hydrolase
MVRPWLAALLIFLFGAAAQAQQAPEVDRPLDEAYLKRLAKQIEPDLKGRSERLPQYVAHFRTSAANDARLFAFSVTAQAEGDRGVRLTGYVEFPETRRAIGAYFRTLGFEPVDDQLETLPSEELGDRRFGFIKAAHSLSYADASQHEVVTDCLLGEPLFLLRADGEHFLVHGGDGYLGYVAAGDVERVDETAFAAYLAGPRVCVRADQKPGDVALPAGARLKWVRTEGDRHIAQTPAGDEVAVMKGASDVRNLPKERIDLVCAGARQLLGTKYLWGGKTSSGVDCSGLVQVSFAGVGVAVPRDANQQFHMGQLTGTRWSRAAMRRGDTLYFLNAQGRISHTGLYLGDDQFIHAVSPTVRINSFNPDDDNYDAARHASFAFAKRIWE